MTEQLQEQQSPGGYKFSTFGGVFTPSILTIFGLIMFMRTNFVVGSGGVLTALAILLVAESITITTGLSISAISTNTPVKGGGAYFLISRSLGPGFGSSIGLTLFFAQALSVPFYIIGFSEALTKNFPALEPYYFWIVVVTGVVIFVLTWVGADWVIKCQYFILAILCISIVAFMAGGIMKFEWTRVVNCSAPVKGVNTYLLFAIFFPAVTGIMAGVNMSGDLKSPEKSLPIGTLAAIFFGLIVYGIQMIVCAGAFPREELIRNPFTTLVNNAIFGAGFLVVAGVVAATLSSALGSCMGAPRVLQALARDKIIRVLTFFEKGSGEHNEPKNALVLTFIISMIVLVWGGLNGVAKDGDGGGALNAVAMIVTMFFLYTYGMVNLAAFVESYGANPSFRPRFKYYHWVFALFGAVACVVVSFMINGSASVLALMVIGILFFIARQRELSRTFGDARRGFVYSRIRNNMLLLDEMPPDPKNWRPTITVLSGDPNNRKNLVEYASLFECNRGIVSVTEFIIGDPLESIETRAKALEKISRFAREHDLEIFPEVIVCEDFDRGLRTFLQAHSIGPIKPNIVMLGWPRENVRVVPFVSHLRIINKLNMSCVIMVNPQNRACPRIPAGRIDIWWRGMKNGSLMLLLAYLLIINKSWNRIALRILRTVDEEEESEEAHNELRKLVSSARIEAECKVVVSKEKFSDIFKEESHDAVLTLMGLIPPGDEYAESLFSSINERMEDMPPAFLVHSTGEADLLA